VPLYAYRCPSGHVTDELFSMAAKPESIACACGLPAPATFAAPAATMGCKPPVAERPPTSPTSGTGYRCPTFKCDACEHSWFDAFTDDEPNPTACEKCGGPVHVQLNLGGEYNNRLYGTGGYFDRALGVHITSESQRRAICKERGLAYDVTEADLERTQAVRRARDEAEDAEYARYKASINRDPTLCRLRDQGRIDF
jgi:predicted nucleic acid-binding Zn ribbon protein